MGYGTFISVDDYPIFGSAVLLEYIDGKTLDETVCKYKYPYEFILYVCKEILYVLKKLHKKNIMHRDLKPENIMLSRINEVKIVDLAYATNFIGTTKAIGTPIYMAPEVLNCKKYDTKCDMYSFGYLLFKMVEKRDLYDVAYFGEENDLSDQEEINRLANGFTDKLEKCCTNKMWTKHDNLYAILYNSLIVNPERRISSDDAYYYLTQGPTK